MLGENKTETIGKVTLDYTYYPGEDFYCDGSSEDELLAIVKGYSQEDFPAVIRQRKSWEVLYHLSDLRENIVKWLPIDKSMKVLEVGAGCGAVTGALAKKAGSVTCVDLSRKRSLINAYRHKDCDNITIHVGNFQDIEPALETDYDYVCLIGVFEYGQSYIGGKTPFTDFYRIIKNHVKKDGHIAIAIENKMGLKYWAGCREDHLGTFFSGLEDYPAGGAVRTFTKGGLEKILKECGETDYQFYYPYPDYKFMTMAYSDRYLPKVGELSNNLRNFDRSRMLLFNEKNVFDMLIREELFPLYSNSYMVVTGPKLPVVYSRFSNDRAEQFAIRTDILETESGLEVRKYPDNPAAASHIRSIGESCKELTKRYEGTELSVNRCEIVSKKEEDCKDTDTLTDKEKSSGSTESLFARIEFLYNAVTLEELLDEALKKNEEKTFLALFERYENILKSGGEGGLQDYDLIFPNICVQGDKWTVIDYEWCSCDCTPDEIIKRALYCYLTENPDRENYPAVQKVLERIGLYKNGELCRDVYEAVKAKELAFQEHTMLTVKGEKKLQRTCVTDMRHLIGRAAVSYGAFFAASAEHKVQMFEDYGNGFSEENSSRLADSFQGKNRIRFNYAVMEGVMNLRFDPADEACILRFEQFLLAGKPVELTSRAVNLNGVLQEEGNTVLFTTSDPNIVLQLDKLGAKEGDTLEVEAEICFLSPGIAAGMEKSSGRKRSWFLK